MAPSRPAPVYAQPSDSSSSSEEENSDETMLDQKQPMRDEAEKEEEEDDDEEEEDEEETDDDEETIPQPTVEKQIVKKPVPLQLPLPLESESESEGTESEDFDMQDVPSPSTPNFTIKPSTTASKPVDNPSTKSKKSPGKADPPAAIATTQARSSSKRPLEGKENGKDSPKKRGKSSNGGEEKSGNTRLWSENDQIAILKGMIDYQSNSGADPLADAAAFHDVMKKSLHVDVSKGQMIDKIRRMKKYQTNAVKGENGQDPVFAKPHDSQSFELSKRIWGVNGETTTAANNNKVSNGVGSSSKRRVKKKVKVENPQASSQENGITDVKMDLAVMKEETKEDFWKKYPMLEKSLSEIPVLGMEFAKEAMWSVGNSSANELEEKWRKLKMEEIELYKKKIELIVQQTEMIQQTFKSS